VELKLYVRVLLKRWWLIVPTFLVTFTATIVFTFTQAPVYVATATFIVSPSAAFQDARSFLSGLDVLGNKSQVANTYVEIATSYAVRHEIATELGLSPAQARTLLVKGKLRAGTNVIELSVEGNDPALIAHFANRVGERTVDYAQKLYEVYDLKPLDTARPPLESTSPNKKLNLALGGVLGLALGVGLAFLAEYLQTPLENMANVGILDGDTGAYNKRYFAQRLGEEMSRARRNKYPLSLALMNVDHSDVIRTTVAPDQHSEALRKVAVFLRQYLREEDVMARLDETTFALLLPDTPVDKAHSAIEKLQTRMAWTAFEMEKSGAKLNLGAASGIVAYNFNGTGQDELLSQAAQALQQAESAGYGKVVVVGDKGSH